MTVGLRCRHCSILPLRARSRGAVYYPVSSAFSLLGYQGPRFSLLSINLPTVAPHWLVPSCTEHGSVSSLPGLPDDSTADQERVAQVARTSRQRQWREEFLGRFRSGSVCDRDGFWFAIPAPGPASDGGSPCFGPWIAHLSTVAPTWKHMELYLCVTCEAI